MLSINLTVLVQIANFLFLLFILNIILYKPIRNILGRRKGEIDSFEKTIKDFQDRLSQATGELDESIAGARKEGFKERENCKNEGLEEEKGMVDGATASSGDEIAKAKKNIESEVVEVRQSLEKEIAFFSKELATKILGRSV